jgi:hypothetical protein
VLIYPDQEIPTVETSGQRISSNCSSCDRCIGALDGSIGDGLCALCRIDAERAAVRTLAAVELHCRRHKHSGVNLGAHHAYLAVLKIIESRAN